MIGRLLLLAIINVICISAGCSETKKDEEPGEEEKKRLCGNGVVDEWEECDRISDISCSELFAGMIGPAPCNSCKIDTSKCIEESLCEVEKCSNNGKCIEMARFNYMIFCQCNYGSSGDHCTECAKERHYDIDGKCITDSYCTAVGCMKNSTCEIRDEQAECVCDHPYTGENCDECSSGYELVDGKCIGILCSTTDVECPELEKCDDSSGKIECVCETATQDPDDCSKCLPGYDWMNGFCTDEAFVPCASNPSKPENSVDVIEKVLITYTEGSGWSEPAYCDWKCMKNTIPENGKCRKIELFYSDQAGFPFGFDSSGRLIAGNAEGDVLIISSSGIVKKNSYGIPFMNGRLGADGNLYFMTSGGYGVINSETGNHFIFQRKMVLNQLTLSRDGTVFFGDSYFDFPKIIYVSESLKNMKAVTLTDKKGGTLTIYQEGYAVFMDMNRNLLWSKQYDDLDFTLFPVFEGDQTAVIPCFMKSEYRTCFLLMDLEDGNLSDPVLFNGTNLSAAPAVSIDNDYMMFVSETGVLKVYESDNSMLYSTSSVFSLAASPETMPPVISDTGYVYFTNYHQVLAYRKSDNKKWSFDLNGNAKPVKLINNNGRLYVFTSEGELHVLPAPGTPEGKWPQMLHDAQLTGSLSEVPEFERPSASELSLPSDEAVFDDDTVNFKWVPDIGDPDIQYTLLLRDSTGFDKVYAGPEKGLSTATVEGLTAGNYEWRVVSKDENGSLNVSEARTFTIQ